MSRVVALDLHAHNTVLIGHESYFLLWSDGRPRLVHDKCPHRGGPLSLGRVEAGGRRLSCPWHGTKIGVSAVRRTALPMVRSGRAARVVLPERAAAHPVTVVRRRILANLPSGADANEPCLPQRDCAATEGK